ncbi:CcoQ/FixQ family Cbb3-type cytochrome c oxidase assembly chaperone [Alcanivorax sp.]|uniref:cbb3-type cytochrome oxidase subunit 3 n=1 Tax=Alcanivorax sp. TaxID=1872427 RepID=UPI0025C175DA|nr:CcoQ/FixQ family Cbb3-type cytochrome c oxidase assembly chaperone [Alcanivorax sp.]
MSYHALFTLVFFLAFVAMAAWVYRPSHKKDYEKLGYIALDADERTAGNLHKGDEQ